LRKCAKSWESVLKVEKVCQNLWKYTKVSQKLRKCAKCWESVPKLEKDGESMRMCGKCYYQLCAAQMLIFFWHAVQKSDNIF